MNFKKLLYDVVIVGFATGNGQRTIGWEKHLRIIEAYKEH